MTTMNLTNKLHQSEVQARIASADWIGGTSPPFVVELDPTAACDLACPGCISEDIIAIGGRFSNDRLLELGQEFVDCGVRAVILIGGGEPLAHPKVGQLISLLGENDVHIGITTNGSFIDRYLDAISEYAQWVRVSMDAATSDLFSVLRPTKNGKSKFDKIVNNMRLLAHSKKGKLGYSYLIQTPADGPAVVSNISEIYEAAVLARDIGCDYFEVKPTYQWRDDVAHALMKHPEKLMQEASDQIARLADLETDSFKILKAINLQYSLDGVDVDQPKEYNQCPSTHLRTTVTPSGVFVCPYWRGKERMRIGNMGEQSFNDVWTGERRAEVMDKLDPSKDCQFHCLRHDTNREAFRIKDRQQASRFGGNVEEVAEFDRFI